MYSFNTKYFGTVALTPRDDELELNGIVPIDGKRAKVFASIIGIPEGFDNIPQLVPLLDKYPEAVEVAKAVIAADYALPPAIGINVNYPQKPLSIIFDLFDNQSEKIAVLLNSCLEAQGIVYV